jgi:hypothetical protein
MFSPSSLSNYFGSENFYFNPMFKTIKYTDGVKHVSDNGGGWIVTDALAHVMLNKKLRGHEFISIKFAKKGNGAVATYDDGNGKVLAKQDYAVSDIPCDVKMYCEYGVMMLTSER